MSAPDRPGFTDPVADAQACFRAVLDAMARPGTVHEAGANLSPPAPLDPATASVLLTLVDGDVPLWLDGDVAAAWPWLAFHCGAARCDSLDQAAFACARTAPPLSDLPSGTDAEPEESATLVLQIPAIGSGRRFTLSGPGLAERASLSVAGLAADFAAQWAANHALYPRGIDLILCAGEHLCALPRSVRIEEA